MKTTQDIYEFISSKQLMTISSVGADGSPQAAVVGFGQTEDLRLVFGTSNQSRKFANISANPEVAVVIGWDGPQTVQYEGTAREATPEEAKELTELYYEKVPMAQSRQDAPDQTYIVIDPTWVRFTNIAAQPWEVDEVSLA